MLKKILTVLVLGAGFFMFNAGDCYAQETVKGYAYLMPEGNIDHATLVVAPDDLKGVLFIGDIATFNEEFRGCFKSSLDYGLEMVVTGSIEPYDDPYYKKRLLADDKIKCELRN